MRVLSFALMILACAPLLQADNLLQNGDFTDGKNHWSGDGKTPDEYAQDNPSVTSDPLTSKGLIIQLKEHFWTKICQDFKGDKGTHYALAAAYKVSPDITLSNKAGDYTNIAEHVRFKGYENYGPLNIDPGRFWFTVSDLDDDKGYQERYSPKLDTSEIQTFLDPGLPMSPSGNKMVTLAFPPGTGFIVLLNISITSDYKPPSSE